MPVIDTPMCDRLYRTDAEESGFQPKTIKDDMLCAGFAEGKKDACKVGPGRGVGVGAQLGQGTRPQEVGPPGPDPGCASTQVCTADSWTPAGKGSVGL